MVTTKADETRPHAPNVLDREFSATVPNERWVTDITYLRTFEGWVFLAVMIDLCTRKVVGWSLGEDIDTTLALRALDMALVQRRGNGPLLHQSDRGCQYSSAEYTRRLRLKASRSA